MDTKHEALLAEVRRLRSILRDRDREISVIHRAAEAVVVNALDIDGRSHHAAVSHELLNDLKAAIAPLAATNPRAA